MQAPPSQLSGADVVLYTAIDSRHRSTAACRHFVEGGLMGPASALAICTYSDTDGFYLFYCDSEWQTISDTWHETVEAARQQAEFEYDGVDSTWLSV